MIEFEYLFLFLITIVLFNFISNLYNSKKNNYPPGPLALPLIGNVLNRTLLCSKSPAQAFYKLGQEFGPIMKLKVGSVNFVIVSNSEMIKEVESKFMDRLDDKWILARYGGHNYGLIQARYAYWSESRKFTHRILRDSGFEKSKIMELILIEKLIEFCDLLREELGTSGKICFSSHFNIFFLCYTWMIITGKKLSLRDPVLAQMVKLSDDVIKSARFGDGIQAMYPWLLDYFPKLFGYDQYHTIQMNMKNGVQKLIDSHKESEDYKEDPQNLIDIFLNKAESATPSSNHYSTIFKEDNLNGILQDIIMGGNDTQSATLKFGIRYLLQYPEVQKKLQKEVDETIGKSRFVSMSDFPNLKYVQATLLEIYRISSVAPTLPRKCYKDSKLLNYDIPKGTILMPMFYSANMDVNVWENPSMFKPERFLDSNNNVINGDKIMSFGTGKRNCIGETVAKQSLVLVLAHLIQQFNFEIDPEWGVPNDETIEHFTREPTTFSLIMKNRNLFTF